MNSRKLFVVFMVMLMTFGAYDVLAGCGSSCAGCAGCGDETETELKVFGHSRYRISIDSGSFAFDGGDTPPSWMTEMQTRVGIKAKANEKVGAVFQLQDCRIIGADPGTDLADAGTLQMHQGYLWHKPCEKSWLKAGRYEFTLHNGRLVSAVPWDNTGRTFEGLTYGRKLNESMGFTVFALQLEENYDAGTNPDGDPIADKMLYGVNVALDNLPLPAEVFAILHRDPTNLADDEKLFTFGVYSNADVGESLFYDAMFALQTGKKYDATAGTVDDASGMLIHFEGGLKATDQLALSAGLDMTSGDNDDTDGKCKEFNNLYMDYHRFWGHMDLFENYGTVTNKVDGLGLMDIFFKGWFDLNDSLGFGGAMHFFSTAEKIDGANTNSGNEESLIGAEMDLYMKYSAEDFAFKAGRTGAALNEDVFGTAMKDGQAWWYTQGTVYW